MLEVGGLFLNIFERENFFFSYIFTMGTSCLENESHKNQ